MSMTQVVFLRGADNPTRGQIQEAIQKLGYNFKILSGLGQPIDEDGIACSINGHPAFFETYPDVAENIIDDYKADWIKPDLTYQDTAIVFVWGADFAAGACIGLISVALINLSDALVYYMEDQMKYTREMLLAETPQFLHELSKQPAPAAGPPLAAKPNPSPGKKSFWSQLKDRFT